MITLEELKEKLRARLIEYDGNAAPNDLVDLIEEAQELGISEQQIARLVPEVDRSINWEHIRAEKEKERERQAALAAAEQQRRQVLDAAPGTLDSLLSYSMVDGIVGQEELSHIFDKAAEWEQDLFVFAVKVKDVLDARNFKPYPNADLSLKSLKDVLLSTSWYNDTQYRLVTGGTPSTAVPPPLQAPRVLHFGVDKPVIDVGDSAVLSWDVRGVTEIAIAPFGRTTVFKGQQTIRPTQNIVYTLTAGSLQQQVKVEVQIPKKSHAWRYIITAIVLLVLGIIIAQFAGRSGSSADNATDNAAATADGAKDSAKLTDHGDAPPGSNLSSAEYSRLITTMNDYLSSDEKDDASAENVSGICNFYAYPVRKFFTKANASRDYVYNAVREYKGVTAYACHWNIDDSRTQVSKKPGGEFSVDIYGTYSYRLRNPKKPGLKTRTLHDRFVFDGDYKITSVQEMK